MRRLLAENTQRAREEKGRRSAINSLTVAQMPGPAQARPSGQNTVKENPGPEGNPGRHEKARTSKHHRWKIQTAGHGEGKGGEDEFGKKARNKSYSQS
jgi:hypothetical protein